MRKFPTWIVISLTAVLLFGGLQVATIFEPALDESKLKTLSEAPIGLFLAVGIPIAILEALFWTVTFIELSAKFTKSPLFGAAAGVFCYGVLFHWSSGIFSILVSSWIALILNASYLVLRQRSRMIGIFSTAAHKVVFILFAFFSIYMQGA